MFVSNDCDYYKPGHEILWLKSKGIYLGYLFIYIYIFKYGVNRFVLLCRDPGSYASRRIHDTGINVT